MQATIKAFKRMTVEFSHEVDGARKTESLDFVQACNTGIGYAPGVMESRLAQILTQCGVVKPEVTRIDGRLSEPPMFEL